MGEQNEKDEVPLISSCTIFSSQYLRYFNRYSIVLDRFTLNACIFKERLAVPTSPLLLDTSKKYEKCQHLNTPVAGIPTQISITDGVLSGLVDTTGAALGMTVSSN